MYIVRTGDSIFSASDYTAYSATKSLKSDVRKKGLEKRRKRSERERTKYRRRYS